jgi:hypothetical protein
MKKLLSFIMAMIMLFSLSSAVFAADITDTDLKSFDVDEQLDEMVVQYAELSGVETDEILNLANNLENAIPALEAALSIGGNQTVTVPVSENLVLVASVSAAVDEVPSFRAVTTSYRRTVKGTLELQNILGLTVVTLNSYGVFITDGTTSTPEDAYGTYSALLWDIDVDSSAMSSSMYNAWARTSFSGEFDFGIDPVSITIQTFSNSGTVYCNAVGAYSASWS